MSEQASLNHAAHLRELADRLRIRGDYGPDWSDVADATTCTLGADEIQEGINEIERLGAEVGTAKARHSDLATQVVIPLQQQVEQLRAALELIASYGPGSFYGEPDPFRIAREALSPKRQSPLDYRGTRGILKARL